MTPLSSKCQHEYCLRRRTRFSLFCPRHHARNLHQIDHPKGDAAAVYPDLIVGDLVICMHRPEWGTGIVITCDGLSGIKVRFGGAGVIDCSQNELHPVDGPPTATG